MRFASRKKTRKLSRTRRRRPLTRTPRSMVWLSETPAETQSTQTPTFCRPILLRARAVGHPACSGSDSALNFSHCPALFRPRRKRRDCFRLAAVCTARDAKASNRTRPFFCAFQASVFLSLHALSPLEFVVQIKRSKFEFDAQHITHNHLVRVIDDVFVVQESGVSARSLVLLCLF